MTAPRKPRTFKIWIGVDPSGQPYLSTTARTKKLCQSYMGNATVRVVPAAIVLGRPRKKGGRT